MSEHIRYFLDTDPAIAGEDELCIKRATPSLDGNCSMTIKRGILNGPFSEDDKWNYVIAIINKLERYIEKEQRLKGNSEASTDQP